MKNFHKRILLLASVLIAVSLGMLLVSRSGSHLSASAPAQTSAFDAKDNSIAASRLAQDSEREKILEAYGKLPLLFEPNIGQTDESVRFVSRGQGYALFLTGTEAVLSLGKAGNDQARPAVVRMSIAAANAGAKSSGLEQTETESNYFIGNDAQRWQTGVPNFQRVHYEQIYPGVDLVYYGNGRQLEYDFHVEPNADPKQIKLNFDGVSAANVDAGTGDLLLQTAVGTLRQHKPVVYQEVNGERKEIAGGYAVDKEDKAFAVSFELGSYDKSAALTIDPVLVYASYLGGTLYDQGQSIAVDQSGNAYVVGTTASLNFPTTQGTVKPVLLPRTDAPNSYWYDAFVTKVNPAGTALVYSTYFGGRNGSETGMGVALDAQGNVYLNGTTMAADLPTVNAYQPTFGGTDDSFAAKLNSTGSAIIFSTYLGGNNTDTGAKVVVNQTTGDATFVGYASSPNFPTTPGAYKQKLCDTPQSCNGIFYSGGYVARFAANGDIRFATLFDATINDVTLDTSDNAVFAGSTNTGLQTTPGAFQPASSGGIEGFIAKLNPAGSTLVYATYLGGGLQSDRVKGIALDASDNIYVTGQTQNLGFPTTPGAFDQTFNGGEDGFVTKLNAAGTALVYSTFFGGLAKDEPFAIGVGSDNNAFVAGETLSGASFPLRNSLNGPTGSIFLARFNADASALVFSTLLGNGGAYDLALDAQGNAYVTGQAREITTTPGVFQPLKASDLSTSDGFVMKLGPANENAQTYNISGTVTDPTQFGDYEPVIVTLSGTVNRSVHLPYGNGSGVLPYFFGNLPAGGNYVVTARKPGHLTEPESATFNNLQANQFADFTIQNNQQPEGTITSPQHGATFNAPANINITATASDPDGNPIAKVDFVAYSSTNGVVNIGTDTTAPYEMTWNNAPVGTWSLSAIPTDSLGRRGVSVVVVQITVLDSTTPSVVLTSPTSGASFSVGDYVPLNATVSSSINVLEYYEGNNLIGRRTSAPWSVDWRVMSAGTYNVYAKGYITGGQTVTSGTVAVNVTPLNHRITGRVVESLNYSPLSGVTLQLTSSTNPSISATTTTDANGEYLFTNLNGTPDDAVRITPALGGYNFDPQAINIAYLGYIHWQYQNFTATPQTGITVSLTSPTGGQMFTAPATVNFAADASSTAGAITQVDFYRRNPGGTVTLLGSDTSAPYNFDWSGVATGDYFAFARATDATNAVAQTGDVWIRVGTQTTTIRINGTVSDPGGQPLPGITLQLSGTSTQTTTTSLFGAYVFNNLPPGGTYTITPQPAGTMTFTPPSQTLANLTHDVVDIDFTSSAANQAPTVQFNSPANGASFNMPAAVPISVTATDADGQIVHLTVSASNGSFITTIGQSNNGTFSAPWQPTSPGNYTLTAQARDNGGRQTFVQLNITVNQPSPVSLSGRIVNRDSQGIEGVTLMLKDYPQEQGVIATVTTDANGNYTLPNITTFNSYVLRAEKLNYTFSPQQRIYFNLAASQTADFTGTLALQPGDFDGDGETDMSVYRPSQGLWSVRRSRDNTEMSVQFGSSTFGDIPVPGNYDGDQKTDIAVYRGGAWYILQSSNNQVRGVQFGLPTDKAVAGDYDGDGKTDIAVWRPENGAWYMLRSSDGRFAVINWGANGDSPLASDYDGDGVTDLTVWRPSTGTWYIRQSSDGNLRAVPFGTAGDIPLVADIDGDKKADLVIFRTSTGVWHILKSSDGSYTALPWGKTTDIPVPGDYDLDGKTDVAVFRPSEGRWYILKSSNGTWAVQDYGLSGDVPVPASYNR